MVVMAKIVEQDKEVQELIEYIAEYENAYGIDLEDWALEPKGGKNKEEKNT